MSVEGNKEVMLRFIDAVNKGDRDAAEAVVDIANYKENNPAWGAISFDAAWQTYDMVRAAMPDLTFTPDPELLLGEGDKVVSRGTVTGTHTGAPLFGVPASGKQLSWTGIDTARVANGKIVERWLNADILGLMQQLGLGGQ
jgi:predicted ester cyclase